jgi:integrase
MALTFVRTSELIGARWSEFNFEACRWDIPAQRMKMRTAHIVPLSKQAIEILDTLQTLSGRGSFSLESRAKETMSNMTILRALSAGLQGPHDWPGFLGWLHHPA